MTHANPARVAARFAAKRTLNLSDYGLEGMTRGTPVVLYHGTSASFSEFSIAASRHELVNKFYGKGIFLTPSKPVAWQYAHANRNMGLPTSVITDLTRVNRNAGAFLQALYDEGRDAWENYLHAHGLWRENPPPGEGQIDFAGFEKHLGGVDANTLMGISQHLLGTHYTGSAPTGAEELFGVFHGTSGSPEWLYGHLDEVGLDSTKYRPKVLSVTVTVNNPLVTTSKADARKAPAKGYDSVIYHGSDLVGGVPEVAIYDARKARITHVEV